MGEVLGIGCSLGISGPIERLKEIYLRKNLESDLTPAHMKDPKNWPKKMQEEWEGRRATEMADSGRETDPRLGPTRDAELDLSSCCYGEP